MHIDDGDSCIITVVCHGHTRLIQSRFTAISGVYSLVQKKDESPDIVFRVVLPTPTQR